MWLCISGSVFEVLQCELYSMSRAFASPGGREFERRTPWYSVRNVSLYDVHVVTSHLHQTKFRN